MIRNILILLLLVIGKIHLAYSVEDLNLPKAAQNPLGRNPEAKYYTFPVLNSFNLGYGSNNQFQDLANIKPVLPFFPTQNNDFILRPILPWYYQPEEVPSTGHIKGIGDFNPTAFISPAFITREFDWGIGPSLFIPTASNEAFGTGKWSLGPQLALIMMPDNWVFGLLTSNVWSFAGDKNRSNVNQFSFQYFISYNFSQGWYVTSQPTITANWNAQAHQKWTVPFGAGLGRAFTYHEQAINLLIEGYYNAINPTSIGPVWQLQAKMELLFLAKDL